MLPFKQKTKMLCSKNCLYLRVRRWISICQNYCIWIPLNLDPFSWNPTLQKKNTLTNLLTTVRLRPNIILKSLLGLLISFSDPHKFSCGSGSRITKMSIWIRIQTPKFLFGSGSKGGKN